MEYPIVSFVGRLKGLEGWLFEWWVIKLNCDIIVCLAWLCLLWEIKVVQNSIPAGRLCCQSTRVVESWNYCFVRCNPDLLCDLVRSLHSVLPPYHSPTCLLFVVIKSWICVLLLWEVEIYCLLSVKLLKGCWTKCMNAWVDPCWTVDWLVVPLFQILSTHWDFLMESSCHVVYLIFRSGLFRWHLAVGPVSSWHLGGSTILSRGTGLDVFILLLIRSCSF